MGLFGWLTREPETPDFEWLSPKVPDLMAYGPGEYEGKVAATVYMGGGAYEELSFELWRGLVRMKFFDVDCGVWQRSTLRSWLMSPTGALLAECLDDAGQAGELRPFVNDDICFRWNRVAPETLVPSELTRRLRSLT